MAVGESGKIARSTDNGSSWSSSSSGVSSDHSLKAVAFGNNTFVAVGQTGNHNQDGIQQCSSSYRNEIFRSTNEASSWSKQNSPYYQCKDHYGVGYGSSNTFIAVGESGKIDRSTNSGTSWDNMTTGLSPYPNWNSTPRLLRSVAFGNNTFVAVGARAKVIRSTDNVTSWSSSTSGVSSSIELYGVTFGNNTFVAVGKNGTIITSPDGITWTTRTSGTTFTLYGVTFKQ